MHFHDGEVGDTKRYFRLPVIPVWSKARHIPAHARATELSDESEKETRNVLDLHTSETPINTASMSTSIRDSSILALSKDGILEIFAVSRCDATTAIQYGIGKEAIFRDRAHWQPLVPQPQRGMAMLLSTIRVVSSLV